MGVCLLLKYVEITCFDAFVTFVTLVGVALSPGPSQHLVKVSMNGLRVQTNDDIIYMYILCLVFDHLVQ